MTTTKRYIDVAETAKLIRKQLKAKFPAIKFGVRSERYAGGSSINISWEDGPTGKAVDAIVQPFCGGRFDGMIDMAYNVDSYLLPDGSAAYGRSPGTSGSAGMDAPYENPAPCEGAELVHFSASHVFTHRALSADFKARVAAAIAEKYGADLGPFLEAIANDRADRVYVVTNCTDYHWSLASQIWQHSSEMGA